MTPALFNRDHYPTLGECVYLNQASLGLIGQPAVGAMQEFLEKVGRHGNAFMSDEEEAGYLETLRQGAASVLGSSESNVAIIAGASEILSQLPFLIQPQPAQTVLLVESDFPAISRPWHRLAALDQCRVKMVKDRPEENLTDNLISELDDDVAVVAVANVQYATGSLIDIPRLRAATLKTSTRLIVDVTQAAGAIPVEADRWSADALVCSGYKWLGGHGGVALAVMSPQLLEQMPPLCGWMGAPDPFDFDAGSVQFANNARRYTQSTMSYVSVAGLTVSLDKLLDAEIEQIEHHSRSLANLLIERLAPYKWLPFRQLDDAAASSNIVSLACRKIDMRTTISSLAKSNIVCGTRGGRLRVSIAPYNDESDINALVREITNW